MKRYIGLTRSNILSVALLLITVSLSLGCKKEKPLEVSNEDTNYFVIRDNPNDPIDHAIFKFYERTGIASYYSDTIQKKLVSKAGETPERYGYVTLSLQYHPMGNNELKVNKLSSRAPIPALLNLLEDEVVPNLSPRSGIPSILFIDQFEEFWEYVDVQLSDGWTAIRGFKTLGVVVKDVEAMTAEEKKMYAASILAGITEKALTTAYASVLKSDFFDVTIGAWATPVSIPLYLGMPFLFFTDPATVPAPESIGVCRYPVLNFGGMILESMHTEQTDLRSFLTILFYYTEQEFTALYAGHPVMLQKYAVLKELTQKAGFKLPE